jgi:arginine/lysine/ornithine decarboxylase
MASIDHCLRLLSSDKDRLFGGYRRNLEKFGREAGALKNLSIMCKGNGAPHPGIYAFDPGKIVIITKKTALSGYGLVEILRDEYKIELEMASARYAVAMTSICDTEEGFSRLIDALKAIDRALNRAAKESGAIPDSSLLVPVAAQPVQAEPPGEVLKRRGGFVSPQEAIGAMSLEYVWAYPPGIPVIVPGEIVDAQTVSYIDRMAAAGISPKSTKGRLPQFIYAETICYTV